MTPTAPEGVVGATATANLVLDSYDRLPAVIARVVDDPAPVKDPGAFSPGFLLPDLDDATRRFFAVADAAWRPLGDLGGHPAALLDLTLNPGTHTTKTFASMLIVARAVEYVRRTGERVLIFTPTSANKGTALRDAVLRAVEAGLVTPDQLRVAVLAPRGCQAKQRSSRLSADPGLRRLNPLLCWDGDRPEEVKAVGRDFVRRYAETAHDRDGLNVWFSLELRNYLVADAARAFFEQRVAPTAGAPPRVHAHAVSSAYGLLGYNLGRDLLEADGTADPAYRPGFLLVQHLGTPDMVLHLRHGSFDRAAAPAYRRDPGGLFRQDGDPRFPAVTYDPTEVLDPTFYTHQPPTAPSMTALIQRHGGDGIVVSLAECLQRYPQLRALLDGVRPLPPDPRQLREWSLVMALTGVLNAVERGLVPEGAEIVVHGSGSYGTADFDPIEDAAVRPVASVEDVAAALLG
ncbi:MAG: DUF6002 family protein [Mycobacteriales bacterium]